MKNLKRSKQNQRRPTRATAVLMRNVEEHVDKYGKSKEAKAAITRIGPLKI